MKKSILLLWAFLIIIIPLRAQPAAFAGDTLLNGIQDKIDAAFMASFRQGGTGKMEAIDCQLEKLPASTSFRDYWLAYSAYYQAIYYLKFNRREQSAEKIAACISRLESKKDRDSEAYALLALAQSFSFQFASGMQAGVLSAKVRRNAEKACELAPSNPRAWYVRGSNDYYTPKSLGGGEKTEEYLLKAIALDEGEKSDMHLPRWGKPEAYGLLISFYLDRKDKENARKYIDRGLALYPDDYGINECAAKLETGED